MAEGIAVRVDGCIATQCSDCRKILGKGGICPLMCACSPPKMIANFGLPGKGLNALVANRPEEYMREVGVYLERSDIMAQA